MKVRIGDEVLYNGARVKVERIRDRERIGKPGDPLTYVDIFFLSGAHQGLATTVPERALEPMNAHARPNLAVRA